MNKIIGRKKEQQQLLKLSQAKQSVFLAIYGRRRVGKTYLIRTFFKDQFDFYASGVSNVSTAQQLAIFHHSLIEAGSGEDQFNLPKDWFEAFGQLKQVLSNSKNVQKRIFLDELPWLDTPRSNFGKKKHESLYQLIDFYSLFYLKFIEKSNREDTENWISGIANSKHRTWSE